MSAPDTRARIFAEIQAERERQDAKWGVQNHPDVFCIGAWHFASPAEDMAAHYGVPTAAVAKAQCDGDAKHRESTWARILVEEVAEVVEAATLAERMDGRPEDVDRELVQLAAVCVSWLEARARRRRALAGEG